MTWGMSSAMLSLYVTSGGATVASVPFSTASLGCGRIPSTFSFEGLYDSKRTSSSTVRRWPPASSSFSSSSSSLSFPVGCEKSTFAMVTSV